MRGRVTYWNPVKKIGKLLFKKHEILIYKSLGGISLRKGMIVDFELDEFDGKAVARFAYPVEPELQIAIGNF